MSYPNTQYTDGWFGGERELTVVPNPLFPFMRNLTPDAYSRGYARSYQVAPGVFVPKITRRTAWTNLLIQSEDFTAAAWTKTNLTPSTAAGVAPDGRTTLNKLLETVTNSEHSAAQPATVTAVPTELYCFAVAGLGRSWIRLAFTDSAAAVFSAFFNVASGYAISPAANTTALVVPMGNSQFQCILRFTPAAGAGTFKVNVSTDGATISYAGDVTKGVYLWGTQVAAGTSAPYISTTSAARSILAPDRDKTDPMAYLVDEQDPNVLNSNAAIVARKFARVPLEQDLPTSLRISKPALSGTFPQVIGAYRVFQPNTALLEYDAYAAQTVLSDSGASSAFYPTGGTYTITFAGNTTGAIAYNASNTTVQTALNALTSVSNRGSVVVTGTYNSAGGFTITFNTYAAATVDASGLTGDTGSGGTSSINTSAGGYSQAIEISRTNIDAPAATANSSLTWSGGTGLGTVQYAYNNFPPVDAAIEYVFYNNGSYVITGGTYTLTAYGQTTAAIAYNADAPTVLAAINLALTNLVARGVLTVTVNPNFSYNGSGALLVYVDIVPRISGGTYTVTMFGQTTGAIAYNASTAAIATALNALSAITNRGGCTVTGAGYHNGSVIDFTVAFTNAVVSGDASALTPAGSSIVPAVTDGGVGRIQTVNFTAVGSRTLFVQNHGITTSDVLYAKTDATYTLFTGTFTVPSANLIILYLTPGSTIATATAITELGKRTKKSYTPGTTTVRANEATTFYLPGVTPGITTAADIPLAVDQSDQATFLAAVFSGAGEINYIVGQWQLWNGSVIVSQASTQIAAADV